LLAFWFSRLHRDCVRPLNLKANQVAWNLTIARDNCQAVTREQWATGGRPHSILREWLSFAFNSAAYTRRMKQNINVSSTTLTKPIAIFLKGEIDMELILPKLRASLEDHTANVDQAYIDFCRHEKLKSTCVRIPVRRKSNCLTFCVWRVGTMRVSMSLACCCIKLESSCRCWKGPGSVVYVLV
jgi:hypothetical protein